MSPVFQHPWVSITHGQPLGLLDGLASYIVDLWDESDTDQSLVMLLRQLDIRQRVISVPGLKFIKLKLAYDCCVLLKNPPLSVIEM